LGRQQMMSSPRLSAIVVLASTFAVSVGLAANNPPRFDPRDDSVATPGAPRLGIEPIAPAPEPAVTGNPLWGIPLKSLTATRPPARARFPPPRAPRQPLSLLPRLWNRPKRHRHRRRLPRSRNGRR